MLGHIPGIQFQEIDSERVILIREASRYLRRWDCEPNAAYVSYVKYLTPIEYWKLIELVKAFPNPLLQWKFHTLNYNYLCCMASDLTHHRRPYFYDVFAPLAISTFLYRPDNFRDHNFARSTMGTRIKNIVEKIDNNKALPVIIQANLLDLMALIAFVYHCQKLLDEYSNPAGRLSFLYNRHHTVKAKKWLAILNDDSNCLTKRITEFLKEVTESQGDERLTLTVCESDIDANKGAFDQTIQAIKTFFMDQNIYEALKGQLPDVNQSLIPNPWA